MRKAGKIASVHLFCFLLSCTGALAQAGDDTAPNPLYSQPAQYDFSHNPALLKRILASPHGYFRFINIPFSQEICRRSGPLLRGTPAFNLHGDAHIEQYAITDLGRGLTDFDDSSSGPAVIDLMRFGVSLHLACRENGWCEHAEQLYGTFLRGYRAALMDPATEAPIPSLVARIKTRFKFNREKYFAWVQSIMEPMPDAEQENLVAAMQPYIETIRLDKPNLAADFFGIKQVGYLKLGIGSARDRKFLVRIEGESNDALDDVVLEVKQVRDLSAIDCITISQKNDPFRVLIGQARIAYEPYRFLGYLWLDDMSFWVHSWVDNYREIEIEESFHSLEEMAEIAFDVGVQLGRGHTNQIAAPLDVQLRREQIRFLDHYEAEIIESCTELTDLTIAAWEKFCKRVEAK